MEKQNKIILPDKDWLKSHANAYRVTIDGNVEEITPKNGKYYTLEEMYKYCNTDIVQFVYLPENCVMVCDEEGALKSNKRQNWIATKILADAADAIGQCLEYFIYGDVMIVKESELK